MTRGEYLREWTSCLAKAGIEQAGRDARLLFAHALGVGAEALIVDSDAAITPAEQHLVDVLLRRREKREPVSRIKGKKEFWSLTFTVSAAVLDPRPDSEVLVEQVLSKIGDRRRSLRLLDLGTGSGCLVLSLLSELPAATGLGVDISPGAVDLARSNAERLGMANRCQFVVGDWNESIEGSWDVVVCNPPYVESALIASLEPEVRDFDPRSALDGGSDGLAAFRGIVPRLPRILNPGGWAAFEADPAQTKVLAGMMLATGFEDVSFASDLAGRSRCVLARRPKNTNLRKKTVGMDPKHH